MSRRLLFIILTSIITLVSFSQSHNITSSAITFKQFKKDNTEKLVEAKSFIDQAYNTESTSNDPKMWNWRAKIYLKIAQKIPEIDQNAVIKATEAHLKCLQTDHKGRIIVKKWTAKEDVLSGLVQCAYKLFNTAIEEYNNEKYTRSINLYNMIFDIIPHDEEDQLKRGNITKETILYNSFFSANKMQDHAKSKEILQKLIDINFNEPTIYISMSNIYKKEGNIDKAIEYLALGREMFEEDQSLINTELNLFIELGRTNELITKLNEAIEYDNNNELLFFNRATIYDQKGDVSNAEKDYKSALSINSSYFEANYNLGALYFNYGVKLKDDASNTSLDSKYQSLKKQADNYFSKALPYLESAFYLKSDDRNTIISLKQLYALKGNYEKSKEMKELLIELDQKK